MGYREGKASACIEPLLYVDSVQKDKWDIRIVWTMEMRLAEIQGIPTIKVHRRTLMIAM